MMMKFTYVWALPTRNNKRLRLIKMIKRPPSSSTVRAVALDELGLDPLGRNKREALPKAISCLKR